VTALVMRHGATLSCSAEARCKGRVLGLDVGSTCRAAQAVRHDRERLRQRRACTTRWSMTRSRSQSGGMQPYCTSCWIWLSSPPLVALLIAHAASRLISSSPCLSRCTMGSMQPDSMTALICSFVPAVTFEIVQHASFTMLFLCCCAVDRIANSACKRTPLL
jgi:hypothetical protein